MKKLDFALGSYCDANPDGSYCVLFSGSRLHTNSPAGDIALPGMDVLQVRIAPNGKEYAGVGALDDLAKHWNGSAWVHTSRLAYGPSSCIFDRKGVLRVHSQRELGPIGYRYVDEHNNIVTGESTYIDNVRHIYEWTQFGDVTVGQGGDGPHGPDPVLVLYRGKRHILAEGQCRFIRFQRQGDNLVVAWVNQHNNSASIRWLTTSEIPSLPEQRFSTPTPAPKPNPKPEPPKEEEPKLERKELPADVHAIVVALHARNTNLALGDDDARRQLAKKIAETVRARKGEQWGWKSAHSNLSSPAKDAIAEIPEGDTFQGRGHRQRLYIWDLFNGSTRKPNPMPVWSVKEEEMEQYFIPVEPIDHLADSTEPNPVPEPEPKPDPAPDPDVLKALREEMRLYRELILDVKDVAETAKLGVEALNNEMGAWDTRLDAVEEKLTKLRVKGSTSRDIYHAHSVDLPVVSE